MAASVKIECFSYFSSPMQARIQAIRSVPQVNSFICNADPLEIGAIGAQLR
jgi:hypothetical protein